MLSFYKLSTQWTIFYFWWTIKTRNHSADGIIERAIERRRQQNEETDLEETSDEESDDDYVIEDEMIGRHNNANVAPPNSMCLLCGAVSNTYNYSIYIKYIYIYFYSFNRHVLKNIFFLVDISHIAKFAKKIWLVLYVIKIFQEVLE